MTLLETDRGASIFVDFEIVNHDPWALRLFAGDRANRGRSLGAGFGVVDQDQIECFEIEIGHGVSYLTSDELESPTFVALRSFVNRLRP